MELLRARTSREELLAVYAVALLSMRSSRMRGSRLFDMFGKRVGESLGREVATPKCGVTVREFEAGVGGTEQLYTHFVPNTEPSALPYVRISIGRHWLLALVDSGSDRTILGAEGKKLIKSLGLPIETSYSA